MAKSPIHYGDSYKYGHSEQYRPMVAMHDYMSSRGGVYPKTLFTGAQGLIKRYLTKHIKKKHVIKLAKRAALHGVPFDFDGWMHIVKEHNGYMPVEIKAIPEGSLVPTGMVLLTVTSTDPVVPWVAGFIETLLMKIWYPTTISTKSYYVMQMLLEYGSPDWAKFAFHAFGDRACTVPEAAEVAGFAHLAAGFGGTDNFDSLDYCEKYYGVPEDQVAGYSVFATEHSTTTSYGRNGEEQFVYDQLLAHPDRAIMSFVADSYDVYAFTEFCTAPGSRIRKLIESRPHQKLVLRPDSGEPIEVIGKMLEIMSNNSLIIDHSIKDKILFKDFSILWGDGITPETIEKILKTFTRKHIPIPGYSSTIFAAENFVFGSGGDLMQNVTRDTQKFAIKCSNITVESEELLPVPHYYDEIEVFKDPITDPGKASMKGKVTTYKNDVGEYKHGTTDAIPNGYKKALETIFKNGKTFNKYTLDEIRERSTI